MSFNRKIQYIDWTLVEHNWSIFLFEILIEKRLAFIGIKKFSKIFKKGRTQKQYEHFFPAKTNDGTKIGVAIASRLLIRLLQKMSNRFSATKFCHKNHERY